ncbi:MAG TPA: glycosyltransferase [Pyrinomonadaceae bacterium]|nr:glycosyltransferase [Pyrinomonadaceae bacterium]
MRLLKLGIYHPAYLRDFYEKQGDLETKPFSVQHEILIADCFGSANFWTQSLNKLNYQTTDIIANAEFLQKRWARENDLNFNDDQWLFEIAAAQIKKFRPEALLVADYSVFTADFLRNIRRECSSIRLILGWCGAPYNDSSVFREWDIALSCIPEMDADFRAKGIRSHHVNHAFAPRILDKLDLTSPPVINFAFTGSVVKRNRFHIEREKLLLELVKHTDLQIWSDVKRQSPKQGRKSYAIQKAQKAIAAAQKSGVPASWLDRLPLAKKIKASSSSSAQTIDERIVRRAEPPVFGTEMFRQLRNSRVVLNNHIDISPRSASNMRLFEATGVGACLLTDWKENLIELFEPEREVLTYRSAEECVEKVGYILEHEDERRAVAAAGQRRTLREHTFDNRAAQIDEIIKNF